MTTQIPSEGSLRPSAMSFAYDVFIIHAAADTWFVQGHLLAALGLAPERVFVLETLEPGKFIIEEIERGVRSSYATIVVLSSAFTDVTRADHDDLVTVELT